MTNLKLKIPISKNIYDTMVSVRRDLHRYPELSWKEENTARRIIKELERMGISYKSGIAGTGIIADIPGETEGPIIALRADMDALPITEETGLEFSSEHPGVMHACGHDGHAAMLVGAAEVLMNGKKPKCPVRLIWQPAEEVGTGAKAMIDEGVLDGVKMIFGGHLDRRYPPESLIITEGAVNAAADTFDVTIKGHGGHGARPHEAVDAVVVGSLFVTALQTIVSREVDPAHPSVISVGSFHAGDAPNVIAGEAKLSGTIRSQSPEIRSHLAKSIERIASSVGQLHEAHVEFKLTPIAPALINKPGITNLAKQAARNVVEDDQICGLHTANMGGEDFAYFMEYVEGCYIRFGSQVPGAENFPAHSSRFDFDERTMGTAAAWFAEIARLAGEQVG